MKKLFEKMKSYSFWVSFSGALIIFINCLGRIFNFQIENKVVEDVIMSIAGLLVVLGFVTKETKSDESEDGDENFDEINQSDSAEQPDEKGEDDVEENIGDDAMGKINDVSQSEDENIDKHLSKNIANDEKNMRDENVTSKNNDKKCGTSDKEKEE